MTPDAVEGATAVAEWRTRWGVTLASDVSGRDGIGWEFLPRGGARGGWAVLREDGGAFPVFSAARDRGMLPTPSDARAMTQEAVADLLAAAGYPDEVGWITRNISAALTMACLDIHSWEGQEWALDEGTEGRPTRWAEAADERVPYAWLRARTDRDDTVITVYQDDGLFGLNFQPTFNPDLPQREDGILRPRRDIPLVLGPVNQVEVVYDTTEDGASAPGVVTEVLLHTSTGSTLLIAAEAYSADEWHLFDESVVALPDLAAADRLTWIPTRTSWRSTEGHPL